MKPLFSNLLLSRQFLSTLGDRLDQPDPYRRARGPHRQTKSLVLRGPKGGEPKDWFLDLPHEDKTAVWPTAWRGLVILQDLLGPLGKVLVAQLPPNAWVDWHKDEGEYFQAYHRGHLVLETNPRALYLVGDYQARPPSGMFFWFDNQLPHSSLNLGSSPRTHLVVDWRKDSAHISP